MQPIELPDTDDGLTKVKILGKELSIDLFLVNDKFLALQQEHGDDWAAESAAINDYIESLGFPRPQSSTFAGKFKAEVVKRIIAEKKGAEPAAAASGSPDSPASTESTATA